MPRIAYTEWTPKVEAEALIAIIDRVLREYSAAGYDLTLRQLYYQMIAKDYLPDSWTNAAGTKNNVQSYKRIGDLVSKAREAGLLDWGHIVDRGRTLEKRPEWDNPNHFLSSVAPQFKIDLWEDQPKRIEVWVEKDALSGVLERACRPFAVPYFACKGYVSASAIWDAGHNRILHDYHDNGQATVIIHLGDHDPSGIDMTRDIEERLRRFSGDDEPDIEVIRIALNMDQVEQYDPPPNPAKETDSRFRGYQDLHGDESWELDALDPPIIVEMIQDAIRDHMDEDLFDAKKEQETAWRQALMELAKKAKFED